MLLLHRRYIKDRQFGFLLVLPSIILLALIVLFPMAYVLYLSLMMMVSGQTQFVGLLNYINILIYDDKFWMYFSHSIQYVVIGIGSAFVVGLIVAMSLNVITRFKGIARTIALWAWAVPPVIASLMWKWILNDTNGSLNFILMRAGVIHNPIPWLSLPHGTMLVLSFVHAWTSIPFIMIILLAGLQTIPTELYEVASIDGASAAQKFRAVTLPLLRPSILNSVMISAIFAFRTFDIVFTLTGGGPGETTDMLVTYVYNTAFVFGRLGYAAALSIIMVFMSMLMVLLFIKFLPIKDFQ